MIPTVVASPTRGMAYGRAFPAKDRRERWRCADRLARPPAARDRVAKSGRRSSPDASQRQSRVGSRTCARRSRPGPSPSPAPSPKRSPAVRWTPGRAPTASSSSVRRATSGAPRSARRGASSASIRTASSPASPFARPERSFSMPPRRRLGCEEAVATAHLDSPGEPPEPGLGLRLATWAIHHPDRTAGLGAFAILVTGALAIAIRRRPRSASGLSARRPP